MNIIADIAGEYDALIRLIKKMPDEDIVLVGDIIDRGPKSRQVIEWAIGNPKVRAIKGNHEHMMIDSYQHRRGNYYQPLLWESYNGGAHTVRSYHPELNLEALIHGNFDWRPHVPKEHIDWLDSRPLFIEEPGLLISHAAKHFGQNISKCCELGEGFYFRSGRGCSENSFLWNPEPPEKINGIVQIYGHMASKEPIKFKDNEGVWAVAIDTSYARKLTGIHWPSLETYQEPY